MKVWVEVPEFWDELLEKAARMEGWSKRTDYLRELIKNDLKAKVCSACEMERRKRLLWWRDNNVTAGRKLFLAYRSSERGSHYP
jgi:hypothetical protein